MPVSDAELTAGLTAALGRPVDAVARRPWPYASSAPMEELSVAGAPPMLFKDLTPRPRPSRPDFVVDARREPAAYALLSDVDAPALLGSVIDERRVWLFVERIDGDPLWQARDMAAWEATARWAAALHARTVPPGLPALRHDAAHLARWLRRAWAMAPAGSLDTLLPAAERAVDRLAALPAGLLHGELYPANVLVAAGPAGPRVRPVDWETAGEGPGVLDLAALVAGDWDAGRRAGVIDAYATARGTTTGALAGDLEAASLLVALQWLGWSSTWSPPREHEHDWLAAAHAAAGRLGP